jgi:hypothetical protein
MSPTLINGQGSEEINDYDFEADFSSVSNMSQDVFIAANIYM